MPDLHQDVLIDLRRIMRAADIYSRRLGRESGLTTPQLVVLRAILDHGNPTVSQISKDVSLSQATVTSILNRLQKSALIDRNRSERDKRQVIVTLTESGAKLLQSAPQPLQEEFVSRFDELADWEQHFIVSALARVAAMMDAEEIDAAPILAAEAATPSV